MFYGIYEHISQDSNGEEEIDNNWEDDEGQVPVVLIEELHWQGAKVS